MVAAKVQSVYRLMNMLLAASALILILAENIFSADDKNAAFKGINLTGKALSASGQVLLRWTAPGDDGYVGRAVGYDIRYQTCSEGPIDSESEWESSAQIIGEPTPSPAGQIDSVILDGLIPGERYYFGIKAYDKAGNFSPMSNCALEIAGEGKGCDYISGDVDGDGRINSLDVSNLLKYIFKDGPAPSPFELGDLDGSGEINPLDLTYLINFIYKCGQAPVCLNN
jgi:hypothetical protein